MEFTEVAKNRRSVRRYNEKSVDMGIIKNILETVRFSPTWKNSQTSRFTVITDKELKNRIAREGTGGFSKNCDNITSAPVLVVLSTVDNISGYNPDGSATTTKGSHWQSFDAGIATELFCLAAYNEGLGTLIMGIYDEDKVKELIKLPEGESVSALIALGYPDESVELKCPKRLTLEEISRFM